MASNIAKSLTSAEETLEETPRLSEPKNNVKKQIVWKNVVIFTYFHLGAIYELYLVFTSAKIVTTLFAISLYICSSLGVTAGAHRLWAHRSYKAKWSLQLLLVIFNTIAHQNATINWARDHRLHHKYSETNADPHNAKNGFFFAHVDWLLCKKHPAIAKKGKEIDLSDLRNNPILMFQKKYYMYLMPLLCFILPTVIPVYCWNEAWSNAYFVPTVLRCVFTPNITWLVNSAAHMFGNKPYDRYIKPSENKMVSITALGEGWHNYHHVFPWDYKAALHFFAKLGLAYDLKIVPKDVVHKRIQRTGDGSHNTANLWGWGDKYQTRQDIDVTMVLKKEY